MCDPFILERNDRLLHPIIFTSQSEVMIICGWREWVMFGWVGLTCVTNVSGVETSARHVLTRPHHFALLWKRVFVFLALSIDITELTEQKVLKINMVWNFRTCIFPIRNPYFAPPCLWLFSSTYLMWLVGQRSTYGGHAMVSSGVQDSAVFWSISQEIPVIIEPIFADEEYGMWITRLPNRTGYFTLERKIFHLVTLTLFPVLVVESSHSTGEMRCDVDAW